MLRLWVRKRAIGRLEWSETSERQRLSAMRPCVLAGFVPSYLPAFV